MICPDKSQSYVNCKTAVLNSDKHGGADHIKN